MQLVFYDSTFNNVNEVKMSSNADALVAISQMFKVSVATNFYPVFTSSSPLRSAPRITPT